MNLSGKTALVTGASRGIGRAIALRLASDGARVVVHYKENEDAANEVVATIAGAGGEALALGADVADLFEVRRLAAEVEAACQSVDILVNNAGWAAFKVLDEVTEDDYDSIFDLNTRGLFFLTQEIARIMNDNGRIVNISSGITRINSATGSVYAASKAAVEAFTRCWADDLRTRGITVNTVSPGMTETDLLREVVDPEALESIGKSQPAGRLGTPQDIADVVAYFCAEESRWLTAQNVLASGGAS